MNGRLMRPRLLVPSFAVLLMLGMAACGSSSKTSSSSKPGSATAKRAGPVQIYRVALVGAAETPRGAPSGSGAAVIAFHGSSVVCWRFAHLHGFTNATFAHIHLGAARKSGKVIVPLSTGPRLRHQGCVPVTSALAKSIQKRPRDYYVNIHSTQYPGGAVRGQL